MPCRILFVIIMVVTLFPHSVVADPPDYPIRPVEFNRVQIDDQFWSPRLETNRRVTVWYDFQKCEQTGRIDNFARAGGLEEGGFQGIFFNDSDVYKIVEGAAYSLTLDPDPKLDQYLDELILKIAAAQEDDGYLYTARTINDPDYDYPGREGRWSHLASGHELYNVGHLYEAAVAHFQATGKRTLLNVAIRNADLICSVFGSGPGQRIDVPGHEEIEIGLVKLYRATGNEKYLQQAKFFIDMRGRADQRNTYGPYCQDHTPIVQQDEAVGHAVRAGYLYAGVADVAALTGDADYVQAIDRIWENIVSKKMHLTGGIGASRAGEAFGEDYHLPNQSAYLETCAAIANALFNQRMFLLHGDAKYIDVLERIIYNGFLSGIAMEGDRFFYPNPLACDGTSNFNQGSSGRAPWFGCSCCPVNVVRFIPAISGQVLATRDDSIFVNLYIGSTAQVELDGVNVTLTQATRYPWAGGVRITVNPESESEFALRLRIPGWAQGRPVPSDLYTYAQSTSAAFTLRINGELQRDLPPLQDGYAVLKRTWKPGDMVQLDLPMPVNIVLAHEKVAADRSRVAIERGPIVYCFEGIDNDGTVTDIILPKNATLAAEHHADLLGGVTVIRASAQRAERRADGKVGTERIIARAIPYYAWAHRGTGEMAVWMARDTSVVRVPPAPTLASTSMATASHCWNADTLTALNDQIEPANSADHDVPRMTWWDHRGGDEWVQYDFTKNTRVESVSVYWFDDTGIGGCRTPQSWRLLYRDGVEWKPVEVDSAGDFSVEPDKHNAITFPPIVTDALRLEVRLRDGFSAGVLEWTVR